MTVTTTPAPAPAQKSRAGEITTLALLAGVTDVTSWILLGGLFTAHITGNLVVLAANLVSGTPPRFAAVLALPVFAVIVVASTLVARRFGPDRRERRRKVLLGAQAALLVAAAVLSFTTHASAHPDAPIAVVIGLCAVAAMAVQNAYLHLVPEHAPATAVMTGNFTAATIALVDLVNSRGTSATARALWASSWRLIAGFVAGCLVGAVASTVFGDHAAVVPAALALAIYSVAAFRTRG
jgi:uncharacterized membrane protein YoaK (UPF0700 family)